jgi:putative ABC transport system permease protein
MAGSGNRIAHWWARLTGQADADLDRELRAHLDQEEEEQRDAGLSPQQARDAAKRAFGPKLIAIEDTRAAWGGLFIEQRLRDVSIGVRSLWRTKWITAAAILTLAIGIGANTALFSVIDAVLLRTLPYNNPERLVMLTQPGPDGRSNNQFAPTMLFDWRQHSTTFEGFAVIRRGRANFVIGGEPVQLFGQLVSANLFDLLGAPPLLGRTFAADEGRPGRDAVLVLSYGLWQTQFNGDPAIVGRSVIVNSQPRTIIGVMPATFDLLDRNCGYWSPFPLDAHARWAEGRYFELLGRLRPGVTTAQAGRDLRDIMDRFEQDAPSPGLLGGHNPIDPIPVLRYAVGDLRPVLLVLWAAVACVLVIACTNVAGLLLVRSTMRHHEMAVRGSLGATRGRLVAQLLTESLTLAAIGGLLGLFVARLGVQGLLAMVPAGITLPPAGTIGPNSNVLLFTIGLIVITGVLFGLVPAWRASNPVLTTPLRQGGRGEAGGTSGSRGRLRGSTIVIEVALAMVLLICAGLLGRSLLYLRAVNPGFNDRHVLTVSIATAGPAYRTDAQQAAYFMRLLTAVREVPGVRAAAYVDFLPIMGAGAGSEVHRDDQSLQEVGVGTLVRSISPQYFQTLSIPILSGRDFTDRDDVDRPRVALVNQAFVDRVFNGQNPIGRKVSVFWGAQAVVEIIGVVGNVRYSSLGHDEGATLYWPEFQKILGRGSIVVQTQDDPTQSANAIAGAIRSVDRGIPVGAMRPFTDLRADASARTRFSVALLGAFAVIAMLLALVGMFGVLAHGVAQRTPEIGVRLALGAAPSTIFRMILREGMRPALVGVLLGAAGAAAVTRLLVSQLSGVEPTDAITFAGVGLLLIIATAIAVCLPALRAAHVDPLVALRE